MSDKFPKVSTDINQFLQQAAQLPERTSHAVQNQGRLLFAMDATASRQTHWDRACHLQSAMFSATHALGGLQVQLCYYRGFLEFYSSPWYHNSQDLLHTMNQVRCLGGHTQIERVLKHALREHGQKPLHAVIMVGDAIEENIDTLCHKAGELGMFGVPLLMVQEGSDNVVQRGFKQLANLSKGAYTQLNESSADSLADFLSAAATYASGGHEALERLKSTAAKQLLTQLTQHNP